VAAEDSAEGEIKTFKGAVPAQGLFGVFRTAGGKPARFGDKRGNTVLIKAN